MLVVGFNSVNNFHFSADLDIDPNIDSPKDIQLLLKKEAGRAMKGVGFTKIVCFDDEAVTVSDRPAG